jgi:ABC-type bacteriocin/lantibiotic exporter with double-glycine peptidase domain
MIGEKGVNLSGGQKARVSLARAIYSERDIYLLDDPISAVDVHVGKFIMHETLNGHLKQTTRILITHALNYCKYTDYIYLMEEGSIVEEGTFTQI